MHLYMGTQYGFILLDSVPSRPWLRQSFLVGKHDAVENAFRVPA
jgi:hypothetical protein